MSSLKGKRILLVDNDKTSLEILRLYLNSWGLPSEPVESGEEALKLLEEDAASKGSFDGAIIDMVMPGMSGLELGRNLKASKNFSNLKLILLTAYDQPGQGEEAIKAGFGAYLRKPIRQSHLLDCLAAAITGVGPLFSQRILAPQPSAGESHEHEAKLILLVEDHPANQMVAEIQLQQLGHTVHIVDNGIKAIEAFRKTSYDLILMDCQMPEMDGYEATRAIRKLEALTGHHIPIIAMTAHAMVGDRELCIAAGMDDYISKPVESSELRRTLDRWLGKSSRQSATPVVTSPKPPVVPAASWDPTELYELFGKEKARNLIAIFLAETKESLAQMQKSLADNDPSALAHAAHTVKGASGAMHAQEMYILCSQLELLAIKDDIRDASGLLEQLRIAFEQLSEIANRRAE